MQRFCSLSFISYVLVSSDSIDKPLEKYSNKLSCFNYCFFFSSSFSVNLYLSFCFQGALLNSLPLLVNSLTSSDEG
jgi:hypothetical protein